MATKDPRIDAYIAKSAEFAKPILKHLRKVVHAGCPQVQETINQLPLEGRGDLLIYYYHYVLKEQGEM